MSVIIYGAGGHGKVVADILLAAGVLVIGFVDDRDGVKEVFGLPILGGQAWLAEQKPPPRVALGIGDNKARGAVAAKLEALGCELVTCIHPSAAISHSAVIGLGTVIMAQAAINPEAHVGRGVIVNTGAIVEHDNVIGEFAHLSPGVALGGEVTVGAYAHLGVGVSVRPRATIGERAVVGAGAAVIADVPDHAIAIGVPARPR